MEEGVSPEVIHFKRSDDKYQLIFYFIRKQEKSNKAVNLNAVLKKEVEKNAILNV